MKYNPCIKDTNKRKEMVGLVIKEIAGKGNRLKGI